MEDARDTAGEGNPQNLPSEKQETRDEMLARHRKENTQLQNKEIELKKAAAKGSKAEQKAKKKQVEEEISKQSAKLKEKQAEELAKLGYCGKSNDQDKGNLDNLVKAIAGASVNSQADQAKGTKPSKSVKRREKRAQEEAAREQRIKDEQSNIVSDRMVEDEKLEEKLSPLGLTINEVKPDGHCLYRAVEDQLARLTGGSSPHTFQQLRETVASYMREHSSDFLPFFLSENMVEGESDSCLVERFQNYCKEVESTAAWGGQLEIGALTHSLRKHIMIYSGSFPDVEMGKEYKSDEGYSSIMLSYHRHAFGLGEHYNSVVPL